MVSGLMLFRRVRYNSCLASREPKMAQKLAREYDTGVNLRVLTNHCSGLKTAHIVPKEESEWFTRQQMEVGPRWLLHLAIPAQKNSGRDVVAGEPLSSLIYEAVPGAIG